MRLTRKELNEYLDLMRVSVPESFKEELMDIYGNFITDDEGHMFEFSEQDIYEQLRKLIRPYVDKR